MGSGCHRATGADSASQLRSSLPVSLEKAFLSERVDDTPHQVLQVKTARLASGTKRPSTREYGQEAGGWSKADRMDTWSPSGRGHSRYPCCLQCSISRCLYVDQGPGIECGLGVSTNLLQALVAPEGLWVSVPWLL